MHDFNASKAKAQEVELLPFWDNIYEQAFAPHTVVDVEIISNEREQKLGIDKKITLSNGKIVYVDEKARHSVYSDILCEVWSNKQRQLKGWLMKEADTDWIVYAFMPNSQCLFIPFKGLQAQFKKHIHHWYELAKERDYGFYVVEAHNKTYNSVSLAIPISVIKCLLPETMKFKCTLSDRPWEGKGNYAKNQ